MTNITVADVQARLDKIENIQAKLPNSVTSGDKRADEKIKTEIFTFNSKNNKLHDLNGDGKIDYNEFWQIYDKSEFWQAIENKSKNFKDPEALKKFKQSLNLALDTQMQLKLSESTLINMKQYLSNK